MKVLILGGSGFIGKNLFNKLKDSEHEIFSFSRSNGLDLTNLEQTKEIFKKIKPDAIINCAAHVGGLHYIANFPATVVDDNLRMSLNIYQATTECCPDARIINPLSNCSYPGDVNFYSEPDWWKGAVHGSVFSYGNSKRFIYVLAHCYKIQYNIRTINFIVPNTFGPGDNIDPNRCHAVNGMMIRMLKATKDNDSEFEIWGTGSPVREWAYVDDVVNFLIKGLTIDTGLTYPVNIAQNKGYSIKESAELIAEAIGYKGKLFFNAKYQDGASMKIMDDTNFRLLFPDYQFFNHKEGIKKTIEYYKEIL